MATEKRGPGNLEPIKVSATCLAEVVTSGPRASLLRLLRPYKENKKGKGFARSVYYRPMLLAVRKYLTTNRDRKIFREAIFELQRKADLTDKRNEQVKCQRNISAIEAYERLYANRDFVIQTNHHLVYKLGPIVLTGEPDLWVTENGIPVLLKIGVSKKKRDFVDVVLTVIRKAAISSGYKVRAKNIVYLNISSGEELVSRGSLMRFNQTFLSAGRQIAHAWPAIKPAEISGIEKGDTAQPSA